MLFLHINHNMFAAYYILRILFNPLQTERLVHLFEDTEAHRQEIWTHADPRASWPHDVGFDLFDIATVCLTGRPRDRPPMEQVGHVIKHVISHVIVSCGCHMTGDLCWVQEWYECHYVVTVMASSFPSGSRSGPCHFSRQPNRTDIRIKVLLSLPHSRS